MPFVTAIVSRITNHTSLVQGHDYEVIEIDESNFRIIDESGEPDLYPKSFFLDCEIDPPSDWVFRDYGDGAYTWSPPEFSGIGFFEDHADGQAAAVQAFKLYLQKKRLHDRD